MVDVLDRVSGLLSGGSRLSPLFNLGVGLLGASGPSRIPKSTGQRIASALSFAGDRENSLLRNQISRERLSASLRQERRTQEQEQRKREAIGQLQQRLQGGGGIPQNELLGLLAGIPGTEGQLVQGLLAQNRTRQPRPTAQARNLQELIDRGLIDLTKPEGQEKARDLLLGNQAGVTAEMLKAVDLQLKGLQMEGLRSKRAKEEDTILKKRRGLEVSTVTDIRKLRELAELNEELRGTLGETGTGFEGFARLAQGIIANTPENVAQAFGVSRERARRLATKMDRFKKLTADISIESLDRFKGSGALSDTRFNTLAASLPALKTAPGANRLVIADLLQAILDSARVEGISVTDRPGVVSLIQKLRAKGSPQRPPTGPQGAPQGARTAPPGISEGTTATNPQTGARLIFRGGRWERLQ